MTEIKLDVLVHAKDGLKLLLKQVQDMNILICTYMTYIDQEIERVTT